MNETMLTGYQIAKQLNEVLAANNLKQIPSQMVYNYISKRMIPNVNKQVKAVDAHAWMEKYLTKRLAKVNA